MKTTSMTILGIGLTMALGLGAFACQKERDDSVEQAVPSAEAKSAGVDPNLAKAVAAASASQPGAGDAAQAEAPPANGVFGPGQADQKLQRGATPVITVGALGGTPKMSLGSRQPQPGAKQAATVKLSLQVGANRTPLFNFGLSLEPAKPKPKGNDDAAEDAVGDSPSGVEVLARITGSEIDPTQASRVPDHERTMVTKLKGGGVRFRSASDGASTGFAVEMAKAADPGLKHTVDALAEVLSTLTLPAPSEPVGPGAYWMATSRDTVAGIDAVTYRMIKVEKVQDSGVVVEMNVRRYAASSAIDAQGVPPDLGSVELSRFQSTGKGSLVLQPGVLLPVGGRYSSELSAFASASKAPGQNLPIAQIRVTAEVGAAGSKPASK
jgi:hypothetical protein